MGRGGGYSDVIKQTGITFNWPIRTRKHDYTGWVSDTAQTTTLHYSGTAARDGVATYVFNTTTSAAPITDRQVLATLPPSLPKSALAQLAGGLNLPAAQLAQLTQLLGSLPDPVTFAYTYQVTATYWVQPASGIVVDLQQREVRPRSLPRPGRSRTGPDRLLGA